MMCWRSSATIPRICRYLHVPAQIGLDRILKAMNRGYTSGEYLEFLDRARACLDQPGRPLTIAGDIIVGFPTETEEDFELTASARGAGSRTRTASSSSTRRARGRWR